ncbi:MAG: hypothetical protein Q8P66_01840 [Candidatus Colwellbacteria bacterium]|nr:hypothetical protein [Candidatus Colwellbacteria bacterium]
MISKKFLIISLITGLLLVIVWVVSYYILAVNSGFEGMVRNLKQAPEWNSVEITQARNKTINEINSFQKNIENRMSFNSHGNSSYDQCVKGVHVLGDNDPYSYKCTYRITNLYSFNGDFRKTMLELDLVLTNEGWQGEYTTISRMINEYYDDTQNTNYGETGLVSSLPSVQFQKNRVAYLDVEYAQRETANLDQISLDQMEYNLSNPERNQVYSKNDPVNLQEIFQTATEKDKYFLTLSIEQKYFEN